MFPLHRWVRTTQYFSKDALNVNTTQNFRTHSYTTMNRSWLYTVIDRKPLEPLLVRSPHPSSHLRPGVIWPTISSFIHLSIDHPDWSASSPTPFGLRSNDLSTLHHQSHTLRKSTLKSPPLLSPSRCWYCPQRLDFSSYNNFDFNSLTLQVHNLPSKCVYSFGSLTTVSVTIFPSV